MALALCSSIACETGTFPQSAPSSSATVAPKSATSAFVTQPFAVAEPSPSPMAQARSPALYGASAATIEDALRKLGWTPIGNRVGDVKGVRCTTVLARRDGTIAEVKSFYGYPYQLKDMLELKGSAQGLGEMTMVTVIVKGDPAKTDELYEQLMGSAPMRHGSGLGQ